MNDSTCLQKGIVNEKTILRYEDTCKLESCVFVVYSLKYFFFFFCQIDENIGEHNCEDDKEDLYSKFQEIVGPKTCYPEHPQHVRYKSYSLSPYII